MSGTCSPAKGGHVEHNRWRILILYYLLEHTSDRSASGRRARHGDAKGALVTSLH